VWELKESPKVWEVNNLKHVSCDWVGKPQFALFTKTVLEQVVEAIGHPIERRIWQATTSAVPCTPIPFQMMVPYSDYTPQGLLCKNIAHTCGVVYKKLPGTHAFCVRMIYTMPVLIQKVI